MAQATGINTRSRFSDSKDRKRVSTPSAIAERFPAQPALALRVDGRHHLPKRNRSQTAEKRVPGQFFLD
jgi:hypothetical protein